MLFGGRFSTEWKPDEQRISRFVFIGRNLNKAELEAAFLSTRASELRFAVGRQVECAVESGWVQGKIVKRWDEGNPYRVQLFNGTEIWAPIDDDVCIRAYLPTKKKQ